MVGVLGRLHKHRPSGRKGTRPCRRDPEESRGGKHGAGQGVQRESRLRSGHGGWRARCRVWIVFGRLGGGAGPELPFLVAHIQASVLQAGKTQKVGGQDREGWALTHMQAVPA